VSTVGKIRRSSASTLRNPCALAFQLGFSGRLSKLTPVLMHGARPVKGSGLRREATTGLPKLRRSLGSSCFAARATTTPNPFGPTGARLPSNTSELLTSRLVSLPQVLVNAETGQVGTGSNNFRKSDPIWLSVNTLSCGHFSSLISLTGWTIIVCRTLSYLAIWKCHDGTLFSHSVRTRTSSRGPPILWQTKITHLFQEGCLSL
jgi:hypothetical protein